MAHLHHFYGVIIYNKHKLKKKTEIKTPNRKTPVFHKWQEGIIGTNEFSCMLFSSNLARTNLIGFHLFVKTKNKFVTDSGGRGYLKASITKSFSVTLICE